MCLIDLPNATYWPSQVKYDYHCQCDTFTHQFSVRRAEVLGEHDTGCT